MIGILASNNDITLRRRKSYFSKFGTPKRAAGQEKGKKNRWTPGILN
jgi:hypothetical protein